MAKDDRGDAYRHLLFLGEDELAAVVALQKPGGQVLNGLITIVCLVCKLPLLVAAWKSRMWATTTTAG